MRKKFDAYLDGMEKGAKKAGIPMPPEVRTSFKQIGRGWDDFYKFRASEWKNYFEARKSGKLVAVEEVRGKITQQYDSMIALERQLTLGVDESIAAGIPDPNLGNSFRQYKKIITALNQMQFFVLHKVFDHFARGGS